MGVFDMEKSLLIPEPGFRFTFNKYEDQVFEISYVGNNKIRYAAVIGGKQHFIEASDFDARYKDGEILCVFAPDKLIINPKSCEEIHRKEFYVKQALLQLNHPTSLKLLPSFIASTASDLNDPTPPSPRTLARWIYNYITHSQNKLMLKRQYKGNKTLRFPVEIYQILNQGIKEIYLVPEYRTSKDVQAYMLGRFLEEGISTKHLPSRRTIQRHIEQLDPYIITKVKKGSHVARKTFKASGRKQISPFALYMVEIDTHYLDIIVVDPSTKSPLGRPFLACAIDVYSRAIVGTYISMFPPSSMTTLAVIKDMITRPQHGFPGGIPTLIIPDNGVEFKNNALSKVCEQLKITLTPSQVGTPDNKPHIERFFKTLTEGLLQKLPGTTFSNPKARGSYQSSKAAKLSLDQVKKFADRWINDIYHSSIHSSTGQPPIVMWGNEIVNIKPSFIDETDANILCRRSVERKINHGQVTIDGLSYYSHLLATLKAQGMSKVEVLIDDLDLSKVYVIDPLNTNSVIQADSTDQDYTTGLSLVTHLEVQKRKKRLSKSDQQKLGSLADLYNLYKLMHEVQSDLTKRKPRLRPLKLQLPQQLQKIEDKLSPLLECSHEEPIKLKNDKKPTLKFGSLEVTKNGKL